MIEAFSKAMVVCAVDLFVNASVLKSVLCHTKCH